MKPLPKLLALLSTALLAGCAGTPKPLPGNARVALVIGNSAYAYAAPLPNPVNDAADMCATLRRLRFNTLCHTDVRTREEFQLLVKRYTELLTPQSVGVVYYSGHGVQVGAGNYLIPTQALPQAAAANPAAVLYSIDTLLFADLGRQRTQLQLVVLDACRNDLLGDSKPSDDKVVALRRAFKDAKVAGQSGLATVRDAPPGTKVFYATASGDAAFDGDGRNGPLTKHILRHITTRDIELEEFFKRVTRGVEEDTLQNYRKRQTPYTYGSYSGTFCFAGCARETIGPLTPTP